jgi:hypothetical protein
LKPEPLSRPVLVVAVRQKEFMTIESRKLMILLFKEKASLWFFENDVISAPPAVKGFWNTIPFFLPITAEQGDWPFMLYLSFDRHFISNKFQCLLGFPSLQSADFWILI